MHTKIWTIEYFNKRKKGCIWEMKQNLGLLLNMDDECMGVCYTVLSISVNA